MFQFKYSSSSSSSFIVVEASQFHSRMRTHNVQARSKWTSWDDACVHFPAPKNAKSLLTKLHCIPVNTYTWSAQLSSCPYIEDVLMLVCIRIPELYSIENALLSMDAAAVDSRRCLGIGSIWTVNAQQQRQSPYHIIQHHSQNIVTASASCRAATKISMKYYFVSVCIGRTEVQHRFRGYCVESHRRVSIQRPRRTNLPAR